MSSQCPACGAFAQSTVGSSSLAPDSSLHIAPGTRHHEPLTSNEVPLELDLIAVKSVISKTDVLLACLDTDISRLRDRLNQLEDERATLQSFSTQNKAILSPLRRIPPEILGDIFSWTLPSVDDALDGRGFHVGRSPWFLGQVSSRWRAVALSRPSLWSLVVFDFPHSSRHCPLPILEIQIARARSLKIHLYGCEESDSRLQLPVFQCLSLYSSRWEELSISLTSELMPCLASLRNRIPCLRRLWISWSQPESQASVDSIDAFNAAPSLLDAGIYNEYRHVPILLPSRQLTRYQHDAPWTVHAAILKLAPNLVEARLTGAFDDDEPWPEPGDAIDLLHLRRLYISQSGSLMYLRTPALQEIALRIYKHYPELLPDLESFAVRSACNFRRVCFEGSPDVSTASEILHKYPSITELAIVVLTPGGDEDDECEAANALLSHLTISNSPGATAVSTQLCAIEFGCDGKTSIDYALYLKMMESRWREQNCAFKSAALLIDSGPGPNPATLDGLDSLRKDGLDLLLLHGEEAAFIIAGWTYNSTWN
ncbi:hypothetical protein FB451DRAFT_448654 [Mycena latifolia]|nr:hypothetical protein FB451DRAFT_448654 [Mycena latifolia]